MTSNATGTAPKTRERLRAKKACKACNSRRVRCNAMEEQPCKNCRSTNASCELIQSRRGKYERHPNHKRPRNASQTESASPSAPRRESITHEERGAEKSNGYTQSPHAASIVSPRKIAEDNRNGIAATPGFQITPPASASPMNTMNGADSTVFLGESSSISLVHTAQDPSANHPSPQDKTRLRYPIPDAVSLKTSISPFEARRRTARIEYLAQGGAFTFPSNDVCEALLEAFFLWFHPCFPVLDRHVFFNSYITKTVSPLLFQAVLFVGATHCNEKTMKDLGYPDRQEARNTMYNHAKDIYDADYETDKIIVSQALFLMSFWRAGPLLEKDTRHWLGAAISLAQTKGMHRSSSSATFSDNKLRKRIWWSLYVRDRQCSAALGLPTRIRDEDCDLEMLAPSDFEEENLSTYPKFLGVQKREHVLYGIQMAKLAIYLGKIVLREFAPVNLPKSDLERSKLGDDLLAWESELSPEMSANATASSFWASMLHLSYNNLYILLYRSAYLGAREGDDQDVGNIALQAACRNTRIIEDVISQDLVQRSNVHITTSLFNSLCIHTICLRRSKDTTRKLAEYRAQLCLLGLRELQKTWDVTNWVLQLFLQFLDQSTAKRLQISTENEEQPIQQTMGISRPTTLETSDTAVEIDQNSITSQGYGLARSDEISRDTMSQGLDFASLLFGSKEAEDFSMFQLQPDLFSGDVFGGGLDQYYQFR